MIGPTRSGRCGPGNRTFQDPRADGACLAPQKEESPFRRAYLRITEIRRPERSRTGHLPGSPSRPSKDPAAKASTFLVHLVLNFFHFAGAGLEPFFRGAAILLCYWPVLFWLYRRKLFLKIQGLTSNKCSCTNLVQWTLLEYSLTQYRRQLWADAEFCDLRLVAFFRVGQSGFCSRARCRST